MYITKYCHNIEDTFLNFILDIDNINAFEEDVEDGEDYDYVSYSEWIVNDNVPDNIDKLKKLIPVDFKQILEMVCHIIEDGGQSEPDELCAEILQYEQYDEIFWTFFLMWEEKMCDRLDELLNFKRVSTRIAISKLKRNAIVNNGILLKLNMKNCGIFD